MGSRTSAGPPSAVLTWITALRAAHSLLFQAYRIHGSFQCVRGPSTPQLSKTSRWNTIFIGMGYGVWMFDLICALCCDTHAPARFGDSPLLRVPLQTDVRACAPPSEGLWDQWFSRETQFNYFFGRRRSPDQSATQLESNNQRSSSTSPGLAHGGTNCHTTIHPTRQHRASPTVEPAGRLYPA
jgi:hypothetical protein